MDRFALVVVVAALAACSSSHTVDDDAGSRRRDGGDGECGPCDRPCCGVDPVTGARVPPFCPPRGLECEGPPCACPEPPPGCYVVGDPCACEVVCEPPDPCRGLTEAECWGEPGCAATYDDDCCPTCRPTGGCADCTDPVFYECVARSAACDPDADSCALVPYWQCDGSPSPCGRATASLSFESCDVAGCVIAMDVSGGPISIFLCNDVHGGSCTAACRTPPPECPPGWTAEADGTCWTGWCLPVATCTSTGIAP